MEKEVIAVDLDWGSTVTPTGNAFFLGSIPLPINLPALPNYRCPIEKLANTMKPTEYDEPEFETEVVNAECHPFQTMLVAFLIGVILCAIGIFIFAGVAIIVLSPLTGLMEWLWCYHAALLGPCPNCLFLVTIKKNEPGCNCPHCEGLIVVDGHRFIRVVPQ